MLVGLALAAALSGCGFQLRGDISLPPEISPVIIGGVQRYDNLYRELVQGLKSGNVTVTSERDQAKTMLLISKKKFSQLF